MRPGILDIEASGFGDAGYPIEVGVVLPDGRKYCSLITPITQWRHWDEGAAHVHGITRAMLATRGRSVRAVAEDLNTLVGGGALYSDGWVVDSSWLVKLIFAAGLAPCFRLSPLELILDQAQMRAWHAAKDSVLADYPDRRHRASFNAFVIQETYWRTRRLSAAKRANADRVRARIGVDRSRAPVLQNCGLRAAP